MPSDRPPVPPAPLARLDPAGTAISPRTLPVPDADADRLRGTVADGLAANTRRAYAADWRTFEAWCIRQRVSALPASPATVAAYVDARAAGGARPSTIVRALTGIATAHRLRGLPVPSAHDCPEVALALAGVKRRLGTEPAQKAAVLIDDLRRMSAALPPGLHGIRDRALLVLGFSGAFRRGELVRVRCDEVEISPDRSVLVYRSAQSSKANQEGRLVVRNLEATDDPAICPVRALQAWLDASGVREGPLFRRISRDGLRALDAPLAVRGDAVAAVVKKAGAAAGIAPATLGAHSLRAGFVTSARLAGFGYEDIREQTGHRRLDSVAGYDRRVAELKPRFGKRMEKEKA